MKIIEITNVSSCLTKEDQAGNARDKILWKVGEAVSGKDVFPQLKELSLWELGKLKSICSGNLPALEKLKIHVCRLLQKLPLLIGTDCKLKDVVIGGEKEWQKNLKWEDNRIFQRVKPKVPRAFKL
ncbi:hypothetical protein MRB53_021738 [Persea americana]|uniref:Uncharacterized protein n=1 Tax=Persea americana TaxID=3435 RepID=A0ACC2L5H2_PERAE|nr:hypothetical protein MRB53_021738 [Persea americana]